MRWFVKILIVYSRHITARGIMRYFIALLTALIMINILHDILLRTHSMALLGIFGNCEKALWEWEKKMKTLSCKVHDSMFLLTAEKNYLTECEMRKLADTKKFPNWFPIKFYSRISKWLFWIFFGWLKERGKNGLTSQYLQRSLSEMRARRP